MNKQQNHLIGQNSPYLLQHLYNPVDWYPWGDQALNKARNENKPLLISIGYSACHWCHVMERESFENAAIAEIMNANFVCIKVDREERPDIDHLYMSAVQIISGQGGWPLNCFALPDGRPFWGATYFPPDQWVQVLKQIDDIFRHKNEEVVKQAQELTQGVAQSNLVQPVANTSFDFSRESIETMFSTIIKSVDFENGGISGSPKFPLPAIYEFLLHYYDQYAFPKAWEAVNITLQKMAMGGIYDQIGGGFARYSTDAYWKVPHFEKMLYDNAQLISIYSKAWKIHPNPLFRDVVYETLEFVARELTSIDGTFYSALDADSQGHEGWFYIWDETELQAVIGEDAQLAIAYFNVGKEGLWEKDKSILLRRISDEDFAQKHHLHIGQLSEKVKSWKKLLLEERAKRIRPGLDNKILVSWNGLMISALIEAHGAFQEVSFLEQAKKAMDYIIEKGMEQDGKLYHTLTNGAHSIDGFLEDYASVVQALIHIYQATMHEKYLQQARFVTQYVIVNFSSESTEMFSFSSQSGEKLPANYYEFMDNVIPSSNSMMARNLFYLGNYYEDMSWVEKSRKMIADMQSYITKYGRWVPNWGVLWLHQLADFFTIAICSEDIEKQVSIFGKSYLPNIIIAGTGEGVTELPVLQNRFVHGSTLIYPCTLYRCLQPFQDAEECISILRGKKNLPE